MKTKALITVKLICAFVHRQKIWFSHNVVGVDRGVSNPRFFSPSLPASLPLYPRFPPPLSLLPSPYLSPLPSPSLPSSLLSPCFPPPLSPLPSPSSRPLSPRTPAPPVHPPQRGSYVSCHFNVA